MHSAFSGLFGTGKSARGKSASCCVGNGEVSRKDQEEPAKNPCVRPERPPEKSEGRQGARDESEPGDQPESVSRPTNTGLTLAVTALGCWRSQLPYSTVRIARTRADFQTVFL